MHVEKVFRFFAVSMLQHEGYFENMQKMSLKKIAKNAFWTFLKCPFSNF
jgi:hypothetical protein